MTRAELLAEIAALRQGPARQLLVTGEAGMGKSTVLDAAAVRFAGAGSTLLRASPSHAERHTAYSTLWDLVGGLDWASLTAVRAEHREFLDIAAGLRPPTSDLPALATAIAFEDILAQLAAKSSVLLVIDDVQWADPESRATVERAFRRTAGLNVSLVAASRTGVGVPSGVLALGFDQDEERVLTGLSVAELADVLASTLTVPPTRSQVSELHAHTGGNPLWALELASSRTFRELGARAVGSVGAPISLAEAITERLRSLDGDAADAVSVVALLGHPPLPLLRTVLSFAGIPHDAVEVAEDAGFLTMTTATARTRHPLYSAAAVERLAPTRRRDLHRFMAGAVDDPVLHAQHLQQSQPSGPDERIAVALARASVLVRQRGARLRSAHLAGQAADRTDSTSPQLQSRLLAHAQHLFSAGDLAAAIDVLDRVDLARIDLRQRDTFLAVLSSALRSHRGADAVGDLLRRMREGSGTRPADLALVDANGLADDRMPTPERARLSVAVRHDLRGADVPDAMHRAIRGLIRAGVEAGDGIDEALVAESTRRQAAQIVVGLDDTGLASTATFSHLVDDVATSRAAFAALIAWARSEGKDGIERVFLVQAAHVELSAGDLPAARRLVAESTLAPDALDLPASVLPALGLLLLIEERHDDLAVFVDRWRASPVGSGAFEWLVAPTLLGRSALATGDWAAAVELLRQAATAVDRLGIAELGSRFHVDLPLAEALIRHGATAEAGRTLATVGTFLEHRDRPFSQIELHRVTSMQHAAEGDLVTALAEANAAVELATAAARPAAEAAGRLQRARFLTRLRRVTQSRSDLQVASARAAQSGQPGLIATIGVAQARGRRARPASQLTAAEQRVRTAVVGGSTNREIAAELFISVRTVESHVSAILRKTGATSRARLRAEP